MKKRTRTIQLSLETEKFKSKIQNKDFTLRAIRVSSGHRIRRSRYSSLSDVEFVELQARNTIGGQSATLYIPAKNIDSIIRALQEVRPPLNQLMFADVIEESEAESKKLIAKLQLNVTGKSAYRKEVL